MNPQMNNVGALFAVKRQISPVVLTPSTVTGTGIDRTLVGNPQSCKIEVISGVRTGACNITAKIEDSANNSAWADYVPPRGVAADAAITAISASDTTEVKNVDLSSARQYIRLSVTATGGTSCAVAGNLLIGGGDTLPQT